MVLQNVFHWLKAWLKKINYKAGQKKKKSLAEKLWVCIQKIFLSAILDMKAKADYLPSCTKNSDAGLVPEMDSSFLKRRAFLSPVNDMEPSVTGMG